MKITLCGSMSFAREMKAVAQELSSQGHEVLLPEPIDSDPGKEHEAGSVERKMEFDLIRRHWDKIRVADAILVLNIDKNGMANYVGGNSFLEMGFAHVLGKRIYALNPIPDMPYAAEMLAMQPVVLYGDLQNLDRPGFTS